VKIPVSRVTTRTTRPRDGEVDGRSVRWAAHRAARRDELIDAVVAAVEAHGTDVGMDQIAAVARTSKPVIYRYFADKNDLYGAVGRKVVSAVLATLPAAEQDSHPRSIFAAYVDAYLGFLSDRPALYHFIARHTPVESADKLTDPNRLMSDAIAAQLGRGLELIGSDPALAHPWGEAAVGFVRAAGLWWLDHPDRMTREELTEYLTTLLWDGAAGIYSPSGNDLPAPFRVR
jgi:AcrR family transcriptional regulator